MPEVKTATKPEPKPAKRRRRKMKKQDKLQLAWSIVRGAKRDLDRATKAYNKARERAVNLLGE